MTIKRLIFLVFFYGFARKLPRSSTPFIGHFSMTLRYYACKGIFKRIGKKVNIERNAYFGVGSEVEIGDFSGIGVNCRVPYNIVIGSYVMMAPEVLIFKNNHEFNDARVPMALQGEKRTSPVVIGDDVWIGQRAIINPGRKIADGTVIAAGTVLVRDFPKRSVVGGNPSRLIKER